MDTQIDLDLEIQVSTAVPRVVRGRRSGWAHRGAACEPGPDRPGAVARSRPDRTRCFSTAGILHRGRRVRACPCRAASKKSPTCPKNYFRTPPGNDPGTPSASATDAGSRSPGAATTRPSDSPPTASNRGFPSPRPGSRRPSRPRPATPIRCSPFTAPRRTPTPPHTARPAWRRFAWQPSPTDALAFDGGQSFRCVVNLSRQPIAIAPDATVPARLHRSDRYPLPATGHHPLAAHQPIGPSRDLSVEELGGHRQPSTGPTRNRSEPSPSATPIPPTGPITAWQRLSIFWHTQHLQCGESRVDGVGLATAPCLTTGTLDLDHGPSGTGQRASQADSVAAGAFESDHDAGPGACSAIHARASEKPDALLGMVKVAIVAPFGARAKAAPARVEPPSGLSVTGHVPRYPLPWRSRRPPHREPSRVSAAARTRTRATGTIGPRLSFDAAGMGMIVAFHPQWCRPQRPRRMVCGGSSIGEPADTKQKPRTHEDGSTTAN